ncbi:restriction endonuclease, partial [Mameliella alba]|uniref:restriction endonuclease subunit S n=2 Tax=Mameliella alba TaxID=561184 RepID=UPI000B531957
ISFSSKISRLQIVACVSVRISGGSSPLPEQRAIAGFLDRETAKIDALVEEQRRLIALLKEKRQAVISHAVTKGLDPAAPMKPSGIDWLGDIPAHWEVTKLGRVTSVYCDGPFGSGLKSEHYTEHGARVIRLQNIKAHEFAADDAAYIDLLYFKEDLSDKAVVSGDLLIAGLGDDKNLVGRACVAPDDLGPAMVKADCFRFRLVPEVSSNFIAYQLSATAKEDGALLGTGSTRTRIPLSKTARRLVLLPPPEEQRAIVARLAEERGRFDTLEAEADRAITLLQERRSALISAAVTGKIDLRDTTSNSTEAA